MRKTKYTVKYTTSFKKDFKRAIKRGLNIELLERIVTLLSMGEPLPEKIVITSYPVIGRATGNVTFSRTGYLSTAKRMMCWC